MMSGGYLIFMQWSKAAGRCQPPCLVDRSRGMAPAFAGATKLSEVTSLHLLEPHALAVREPGGDVAAGKTRLALRHLFLRAEQRLPPPRAMRRARQRRVDDLVDLLVAEHEFQLRLLLQVIPNRAEGADLA